MNLSEQAKAMGLKVFDTALPQDWVDSFRANGASTFNPFGHFVWCYDNSLFGYPVAVTETARKWAGAFIFYTMINVAQQRAEDEARVR